MKVLALLLCALCIFVHADDSSGDAPAPTISFSATIYDQAPAYMTHSNFPANYWTYDRWTDNPNYGSSGTANNSYGWSVSDFELPMWMYATVRQINGNGKVTNGEFGLVGAQCDSSNNYQNCGTLGSDGTPVYQYQNNRSPLGTVQSADSFYNWFHATEQTVQVPYNFVLTHVPNTARTYQYSNLLFFPIDGLGWKDYNTNGTHDHNYAFCCKSHATFGYSGGEVFSFYGDDDLFVFLDKKLVIDLGGVHTQLQGDVSLDDLPFLVKGQNYDFDMFYCERHTTESNIQITTSIQFTCPTVPDRCGICGGDGQSCCTADDKAACDDNNKCTSDTCGKYAPCQNTNITSSCLLGFKCLIDSCDPAKGCVHTAKTCNDNSECTIDSCNNATGCVNAPKNCPSNQCFKGGCDPATGCTQTPIPCPASDKCTQWSCNNATGCVPTHTNCDDGDQCVIWSCDPQQGCQKTPKVCTDGKACTNDTCDPSSGCLFPPIVCDSSVCQTGSCDTTTGKCVFQNLTCADSSGCEVGSCPAPNQCYTPQKSCAAGGGCLYIPKDCDTGNPCSLGACDNSTGKCTSKKVNPTGFCLPCGSNACTWNDPCNPYTCSAEMKCVLTPFNCTSPNACSNSTCVATNGVASCEVNAISCASAVATDVCTPIICDNTIGCTNSTSNCNDYNPCTVDTCLGTGPNNCSNIVPDNICNDSNVCTADTCNSNFADLSEACQHTNITCTPPNACQAPVGCDPVNGCQFAPVNCTQPEDFCLVSYCDETAGCVPVPRTCVTTDGNCYIGVCDNVTRTCTQKERGNFAVITTKGGTCFFVYHKKAAVALTAGAIAGIVIAAVVVLALIAFGGKKGYDLWVAHNMSANSGVSDNPLYAASGNSGVNPHYQ